MTKRPYTFTKVCDAMIGTPCMRRGWTELPASILNVDLAVRLYWDEHCYHQIEAPRYYVDGDGHYVCCNYHIGTRLVPCRPRENE